MSRRLIAGLCLTPVVVACGQILGLDGDSVLRSAIGADGGSSLPDGSSSGGGNGDASLPHQCNGQTVALDDPSFGCGADNCEACSVPFSRTTKCTTGTCGVATCAPGRADCNGSSNDGCEADLLVPETCGDCKKACPEETPFCGNDGTAIVCLVSCPVGQTACGKSCVDLKSAVLHCGTCETSCTSDVTNTDPVCKDGTCAVECRSGLVLCDPADPNKGCGTNKTFFKDNDGDGFGIADDSTMGCTPPTGYVAAAGDCADDNKTVFPGQTAYFGTGYVAAGGETSYDYDCSEVEEEQPGFVDFEMCAGMAPACTGSGYVVSPEKRAAPAGHTTRLDFHCGSKGFVTCGGIGSASASGTGIPSSCIGSTAPGDPVPCH